MADGKVIIETGLDDSGLRSGLKKLGSVAKAGVGTTTKAIGEIGAALTGAAGLAIKSGISFESAFAGVKKTVNATDEELARFRQGIRDMAKEMPTSANEIAGVAEAAGQLGIQNDSLLSFTKTMVMLGDSTNLSADEAATSLARLANITGMPQENFDRLGSTVVALGNTLATTEAEIVAMSMRIAGAGSQVGLTEDQIMSFSAALSSVGIEAEAGGTAFSTLLSKMNLAASKGGKALEQFGQVAGMSGEEFKKAFEEDAAGAVLSFIQGLDQINQNGGSAIQTLDEMGLSDIRMRDALLRAAGASDVFTKAMETGSAAWEENTALTNEAEQRYATLESKLGILKNTATDLGISLYDSLENPLRGVVDTATDMVDSLEHAFKIDGFDGLMDQIGTVLAEAATKVAEASPDMVKAGAKVMKSFATGVLENRDEIVDAGLEVVKALAEGIGDLLPSGIGNAFKNLVKAAVTVAKPLLKVADGLATVATKGSALIPVLAGAALAFKGYSIIGPIVKTLNLMRSGQMFVAESAKTMAVATKLNTAATKASSIAAVYHTAVEKSLEAATTAATLKTGAYTVAQRASAAASGVAAVATKGLGTALSVMGGPLGIAVTVIGLAAGALLTFSGNSDRATSAAEKQAEKIKELTNTYKENKKAREESFEATQAEGEVAADLTRKISDLADKTEKTADEKARMKTYVSQLNELMPDLNLKYDEEKDKLNQSTEALWNNVAALQARVEAKAAEENAIEAAKEAQQAEMELEEAREAQAQAKDKRDSIDQYTLGPRGVQVVNPQWAAANAEYEKQTENVKKLESSVKSLNDQVDYYNGKSVDATKWETAMQSTEAFVSYMKESGLNISTKLAEGIRSGQYGVVQSINDVQNIATFDKLSKKAGKGGIQAVNALTKKIKVGKLSPKKAVDEVQALIDFNELYSKSGKGGQKAMQNLKKGIDSGKMLPSKAVEIVADAAINKGKAKSKEARAIGQAIDSGAAGGIGTALADKVGSWATAALNKAKSVLGIQSPSKRFKNEVGKMMIAGVTAGIQSERKNLLSATEALMNSTVTQAKKVTSNFSNIGSSFTSSFASKVESRQNSEIKNLEQTLEKKQKAMEKADKKEEAALEKKIKKSSGSQKKAYQKELKELEKKHKKEQSTAKKAASKVLKAYESALKKESQKLISQAEKNIEKLSETYQAQYDKIIQKRDSMKEKLMDTGDLLISSTGSLSGLNGINSGNPMTALNRNLKALEKYQKNITALKGKIPDDLMEEILKMGVTDANSYMQRLLKMEDDKFSEYVSKWKQEQATVKALEDQYLNKDTLGSLSDDITQMKQYQANLNKLKGRIPQSLMEEILGMGIDDANAYMQQLNALSNSEFNTYVSQWKQKEALANSISNQFFAADIKAIQTNYSKAINTEMGKLKKQMNSLGKNVGAAFASGLKSQSKKSQKAIKSICNKIVKQVKKSLKIKSPSRVFQEIGKLTMVGAEVGTEKEAKKLYKTTEQVAQNYVKRFEAAKLDPSAMYQKMQQAVEAEQTKTPAAVQTRVARVQEAQSEPKEPVVYEFHIPLVADTKELAKATAVYTDEELGKIAKRRERR